MKKRLNLLCACVLIGLLLSTSTVISLMVQAVSAGFKAGYESVEKGNVKLGSTAVLCGFGAGMTWGGAIVRLREGIC